MGGLTRVHGHHPASVRQHVRLVEYGAASVWSVTCPPQFPRALAPVRRTATRRLHLVLLLHGEATILHEGRETVLGAGDFYCDDRVRPLQLRGGPISAVGIALPEALLPLPPDEADRMVGRRIAGRAGALLARLLTRLTEDTGTFQPSDGPRLGTVLGNMVAALLSHSPDADADSSASTDTGRPLTMRIMAFTQRHLSDPELTPRAVAAAHGISLSYLHRLFEAERETVAAYIRRRRLERARFDLADPAQAATPVHVIATRWGFARATDFARAFRAVYGIAPTDFRRQACAPGGRIAT
ncbi:helix-turn-helix domain-containing protein [Streptomyces sp. HD]|uniref:helix-turn-helix domain-containing protein n=1 Tax=Streptomyces sp. HD TaxID=3020892 RepID=UPI00233133EF|nr:helix-turn-helix domain-containing protein [Streptomyces sp. HD]MDC0765944.1 helix-turn-helix domain-containing protein [Streptomyces sp. HD]